uniref:Nod L n=1 Tax=Bradyrhizobium japonicum TaxID=375 RepID=Q45261_BRAJP|nr:nod L [Bradyrhizobium japonicum]
MQISSVSIFQVYPRTIEGAFSLILVSKNRGRRRLRMPRIPGAVPNGSPVQCMWGVSKMYKSQCDLMPLRCAIDEACAPMAGPQTSKRRRHATAGTKARWCRQVLLAQPPRRQLPSYRERGINRTRVQSSDRSVAQRPARE